MQSTAGGRGGHEMEPSHRLPSHAGRHDAQAVVREQLLHHLPLEGQQPRHRGLLVLRRQHRACLCCLWRSPADCSPIPGPCMPATALLVTTTKLQIGRCTSLLHNRMYPCIPKMAVTMMTQRSPLTLRARWGASSVGLRICGSLHCGVSDLSHSASRFAVTRAEQSPWGLASGTALLTTCAACRAAGSGAPRRSNSGALALGQARGRSDRKAGDDACSESLLAWQRIHGRRVRRDRRQ